MRFASLGSGSRGNAVLVNFGSTLLMVDCGLSLRAAKTRMGMLDCAPADVSALLVTHEHSDHIQGVATLATRHDVPVWMTPGTAMSPAVRKLSHINRLRSDEALEIGSIRVQPFPVPHDAREPAQFSFEAGGRKLGVLTDTGYITPHIRMRLEGCDAIAVEFNHDLDSLRRGPYPPHVKDRIASSLGHLSNDQAAAVDGRRRTSGVAVDCRAASQRQEQHPGTGPGNPGPEPAWRISTAYRRPGSAHRMDPN